MTAVKICGINDPHALRAAVKGGVNYIGLVFYPPSPRCVPLETAITLSGLSPDSVKIVGLFVNPDDRDLAAPVDYAWLDMIQLHGDETPGRVAEIRKRFGVPVMKAFRIAERADLAAAQRYADAADWFLFDARVPDSPLPGGTGHSFDWQLLEGYDAPVPWMLSGGLNADNIARALTVIRPDAVDLSSGVEDAPGRKSPEKITAFLNAFRETGAFRPNYLAAR